MISMRSRWVVALLLFPASASADDARQVIEKAIQAQGGAAALSKTRIFHAKVKGGYTEQLATFTGEMYSKPPGKYRFVADVDLNQIGSERTKVIQIFNGEEAWEWAQGDPEFKDVSQTSLKKIKESAYVDLVSNLVPLQDAKEFTLALSDDGRVADRPVRVVKVMKPGHPDIILSFDVETGYLVKSRYLGISDSTGKEAMHEIYWSDYREVNQSGADEAALKAAKIDTSSAGLLEYLAKRTLTETERGQIQKLIRALSDADFEVREKAKKDIISKGALANGLLIAASKSSDAELAGNAKECLVSINKSADSKLTQSVVRLLGSRAPRGTVKSLLVYLSSAEDDEVAAEIRSVLGFIAFADGKPGTELASALREGDSQTRATAQALVSQLGKDDGKKSSQRLNAQGVKIAMKRVEMQDNKQIDEWEIKEIDFLSHIDDKVFAKP